jgi:uncharacterized protein
MHPQIQRELQRLEATHRIKVLYAVESGSRAWGFASQDSDWDVRFIYIHEPDWYLTIEEGRDTIEEMLDNDIDLAGWDIRKTLKLFRKSNPPLLEWLRSPLVYQENYGFAQHLRDLTHAYFSPKTALYHYLSMANGNFKSYLQGEEVKAKKYFYVLRPILSCCWIEQTGDVAPMEFDKLVTSQVKNATLLREIEQLTARKKAGDELTLEPKNALIHDFLEERIIHFQNVVATYGNIEQPPNAQLNDLFRGTLREVF